MMLVRGAPSLPLCVDLDGTLIRTDITQESLLLALLKKPWIIFLLPFWLLQGRAYLKRCLADIVVPFPSRLPLNYDFLAYLEEAHQRGVPLYLVTAADRKPAKAIATYLGIFDEVFASDGNTNLRSEAKGNFLVHRFGEKGFIYAGNSHDDLMVWRYAAQAIAVNAPLNVRAILKRMAMPVSFIQDGDFSWHKMLSLFSLPVVGVSLGLLFFFDWPWGVLVFCLLSLGRLGRTMSFLRVEQVQPLTNLRVHLLLGHIPLSRAWMVMGGLAAGLVYSLYRLLCA